MNSKNITVESVPVGKFVVSKKENRKLVSHLGSCVGLILIDNQNEIGGMYHILLSSPVQSKIAHVSQNFASVGMPQFIEMFVNNGGNLESTNAIIGGGALLGEVSRIDLELDFGGRTSELVTKILNQNKITITDSITGGYFACTMELNLSNLKYKVENISASTFTRDDYINKSQDIDVDTAISRLQPIPQVALKISRMLNSDKYSMKDIAWEIRNDQIISAKVIQLCNSTFMGLRYKVSSVDQALAIIGEKNLVKMVLHSSLELFYQETEKGYSLTKGGLYYHSIAAALASEQIARITKLIEPDVAYTAGLVHDIGKIVLDQFIAQIFPTFFDRIFNDKEDLVSVEENLLGIDHTMAGKRLAELWSLPENLQEAIENHHNPENALNHLELAHIVYFADFIISRFHTGIEIDRLNTDNFKARLAKIKLTTEGFSELVNLISLNNVFAV